MPPATMQAEPVYTLPRPLTRATIHARPSSINKSPYLVDIELPDGTIAPAHNPALGCAGLVTVGAITYVMASPPESKALSKYALYLIQLEDDTLVCINPLAANKIAEGIIKGGHILPDIQRLQQEATVGESRFDFAGTTKQGQQFYIEVKSAPIADIVDCMPRDRKRRLAALPPAPPLFTIFPHGNNRKEGVISPRALKHAQHLTSIQRQNKAHTTLLYLSMRPDPSHFQISEIDTEYNKAIREAHEAGVQLLSFSLRFNTAGQVFIEKQLDVHI